MRIFRVCLILACLGFSSTITSAQGKTQARLLLDSQEAKPGDRIRAAVEFKMPPHWHIYWRNPGESGIATAIQWTLPPGVTAGAIEWPIPQKEVSAGLTTYIYPEKVLLMVPLQLAADLKPGTLELRANASWLECEVQCVPGSAAVSAKLTVSTERKLSQAAAWIDEWKKKLPQPAPENLARAHWGGSAAGEDRPLIIQSDTVSDLEFFPYASDAYEVKGATEAQDPHSIRKQVQADNGKWPAEISGVLIAHAASDKERQGYEVRFKMAGSTKALANPPNTAAKPRPALSLAHSSLGWMLLSAFLGGLILNIMPCVLPVIALKILGFVNQSREHPRRVRQLGWLFGLGVLVSFWLMAAFVVAVQHAGEMASWGMQFQNPQFLVAMTILILMVALNLFGVFEVTIGGAAMGAAGNLAAKEGKSGAFFNGVLATVLATPCTAPFLAVALGFAFLQPAPIIFLIFTLVAVGLAFPYVVLSSNPRLLRFMPKPGVWMEKFKVAMGFPMLATAIWLFYLASLHFDSEGVLWLGLFLVCLALAAWVWGHFWQTRARHRGLAAAISALTLASAYGWILEGQLHWRNPIELAVPGAALQEGGIEWVRWSPEAVEKARSEGHPVLVDFTAKWCTTCQVNKIVAIEVDQVRQKLKETHAVAMIGDFTGRNPEIAQELRRYGRAGVPLVLVYPADRSKLPLVLPEALLPSIVLKALDDASATPMAKEDGR